MASLAVSPERRRARPLVWLMLVFLWLAVLASSFAVVSSTHRVRTQVNELQLLRREASELQVEWGRYLLEKSTWASYRRVESIAVEKLQLQVPTGEQIDLIAADKPG